MRVRCRFRAGRCYGKVEVKCDIDFLAQSRILKILLDHINTYQDQNMLIKQIPDGEDENNNKTIKVR